MNPFVRKSMSTLVIQPSFRALDQMQVKWQTFEKPENKRQMYGSLSTQTWLPYICLLFSGFSNACHFACVCPTAQKRSRTTKFDVLFLMMWFTCLSGENRFMLISGGHFSNRSIKGILKRGIWEMRNRIRGERGERSEGLSENVIVKADPPIKRTAILSAITISLCAHRRPKRGRQL